MCLRRAGRVIASGGESLGALPRRPHKRMSGALPPTPPPAFEKAGPKLFNGKVLGCEQSAVNTEYSVFARVAECKGRLNLFANLHIGANAFRLRRIIFNKISFCKAKAFLLRKLNKSEPWRISSASLRREQQTCDSRHALCGNLTMRTAHQNCPPMFRLHRSKVLVSLFQKRPGAGQRPARRTFLTAQYFARRRHLHVRLIPRSQSHPLTPPLPRRTARHIQLQSR